MKLKMVLATAMLLTGCNEAAAPKAQADTVATAPTAPPAGTAPAGIAPAGIAPNAIAPTATPPAKPAVTASGCLIDQGTARRSAVALLLGDPYGKTAAEVNANITGISCVDREGEPGKIWRVDIVVPAGGDQPDQIEGFVAVDGTSGEVSSIGLPFLD